MNSVKKSAISRFERVLKAMEINLISALSILLIIPIIALAQDAAQGEASSWLRIYPKHVYGIYVKAEDYQPNDSIKPELVVVALTDELGQPYILLKTSLVSFISGKAQTGQGCMFKMFSDGVTNGFDGGPPLDVSPNVSGMGVSKDVCGRFRLRIMHKLMQQAKTCAKHTEVFLKNGRSSAYLFVSKDLRQVRCLVNLPTTWLESASQSDMKVRNELGLDGGAYLHLESNRAFGCTYYGMPVTYRQKLLSDADAVNDNYSLYQEQPIWRKQYFIKTQGFDSSCWGGRRMIDEPVPQTSFENIGQYLNDGTVLLKGETSVLRIRAWDGSTDAPENLVKVFDPGYVQGELDKQKGDHCEADYLDAGDCTLAVDAGYRNNGLNDESSWQDYARHVIQGVDAVMQQIFNNAK